MPALLRTIFAAAATNEESALTPYPVSLEHSSKNTNQGDTTGLTVS